MIQNEFKKIFNAFRFHSQTLSMFSNALKMICNAFERDLAAKTCKVTTC